MTGGLAADTEQFNKALLPTTTDLLTTLLPSVEEDSANSGASK